FLTHLECSKTGDQYDAGKLQNISDAGVPLLARYDLKGVAQRLKKSMLAERPPTMWRYKELLPVTDEKYCISLGEGLTPLRPANSLGELVDVPHLMIKDESLNPTGSFKSRGISAAISAA